jgi:divalent metal cation (Fe/Co/Zn/Cd) transporter
VSTGLDLHVISPRPSAARLDPDERVGRDRLIRRAKTLSWVSLAYMTVEGAVAITAAMLAGSVALLGFGLDSAIEALASIIVIWRFTGSRRLSAYAEQRAQKLVAISFFLLAPYIAQDALRTLINANHPSTSWIGIGLSISSILLMPTLGRAKQTIGTRLGSGATAGEGTQNMLCAYLAAGVLAGLALNAAFGLWWADPAVALGIAALALKEGHQTWHGHGCCSPGPTHVDRYIACDHDCCG